MKRRPHAWVENLVISAALLLAAIVFFFAWNKISARRSPPPPTQGERSVGVPAPSKLQAEAHELKGSGTTSEVRGLPGVPGGRGEALQRKIMVPAPDKPKN